ASETVRTLLEAPLGFFESEQHRQQLREEARDVLNGRLNRMLDLELHRIATTSLTRAGKRNLLDLAKWARADLSGPQAKAFRARVVIALDKIQYPIPTTVVKGLPEEAPETTDGNHSEG